MNTPLLQSQSIEVEWHQLELRYQHLRMRTKQAQQRLMLSIDEYGLLLPIMVAASSGSQKPWVVIDGYLRISASKALGKDSIKATISELEISEALIYAYVHNKARPWGSLEEAQLLQGLISNHNYTQAQLAERLGKSKTWVSHRLQLITELPEFIQHAVYQGYLSSWSASRILLPFARANLPHATQLMDYLRAHPQATRDLQSFYEHYLRSNKKVREHMVQYPPLFFKSMAQGKQKMSSRLRQLSPEQLWEKKVTQLSDGLSMLGSMIPAVFYPQQTLQEREHLKQLFCEVVETAQHLQLILHRRLDAQTTHSTTGAAVTTTRQEQS